MQQKATPQEICRNNTGDRKTKIILFDGYKGEYLYHILSVLTEQRETAYFAKRKN